MPTGRPKQVAVGLAVGREKVPVRVGFGAAGHTAKSLKICLSALPPPAMACRPTLVPGEVPR